MNDSTRIAGDKTVADWKDLRERIRINYNDTKLWDEAWSIFEGRLQTRYFKPIKDIKDNDTCNGEGFSIMAILCSLIEFLESTYTGEIYKYCQDHQLQKFEYNRSKQKFVSFLEQRPPINLIFNRTNGLATEFYEMVRCGLLHEASTKGNWTIRVDNNTEFYELHSGEKVIDRNKFEDKIKEYLEYYKTELFSSLDLQNAFIRKMNNIADLKINF